MKMIASLFFVFAVASSALGIQCPVPPTVPGADISKIAGRWYRIDESGETGLPIDAKTTLDFIPLEDGNFNLTTTITYPDGRNKSSYNYAERNGSQNSFFVNDKSGKTETPYMFYIYDADYDNYLTIYICIITPFGSSFGFISILSRTNSMSVDKFNELANELMHIFDGH